MSNFFLKSSSSIGKFVKWSHTADLVLPVAGVHTVEVDDDDDDDDDYSAVDDPG